MLKRQLFSTVQNVYRVHSPPLFGSVQLWNTFGVTCCGNEADVSTKLFFPPAPIFLPSRMRKMAHEHRWLCKNDDRRP